MANEVKLKLAIEGGQVVRQEIDGVNRSVGQMASGAATAAKAMVGVFAGFAAGQTLGKLVSVQREFDVLNSSLITVTGSSAKAAQEFSWIKQFAATTPYQLNEVTGAFVKMKALGLDASAKSLESYGNTASAMGKGLNQMIEAVADAATGEFERLKEFGIKAKQNGDQVSLTFQGVTTSIGNNAAEITKYLQDIGNNEFAGAMATRAATLDGAISNLADTWDALFLTISTNNAGSLIYDSITLASAAIKDATTVLNALSGAADGNARSTGAMATVQEALAITFETVAVLGANVKYVLVQVGTELGGMAAQAVQILQGNFAGAAAIRSAMVADAATARIEIDATTARILGARAAAQELASYSTRNAGAASDPRRLDAEVKVAAAIATTTKATQAQTAALKAAQKAESDWAKTVTDAAESAQAASLKSIASLEDQLAKEQEQYAQLGLTQTAIADLEAAKLEDLATDKLRNAAIADNIDLSGKMGDAYREEARLLREIAAAKVATAGKRADQEAAKAMTEASDKAADEMLADQKRAAEESGKFWEDALMRAFESGKGFFESLWDTIKNTLKTQVLKVLVQGTMGSLGLGAAGAASAGNAESGLGGLSSLVSGASSLYSGASSLIGIGSQVAAGTMGIANALGTIAANATGTGISGLLATNGAFGTAASGSMSGMLAAIPGWGWAAMAGVAAVAFLRKDKTPSRGTGEATLSYDADGNLTNTLESARGGGLTELANGVISSMSASYFATAKQLGITAAEATFAFGGNTGKDSKGQNFALSSSANGVSYSGSNNNSQSYTPEQLQLEASRAVVTALQASEMPSYLSGLFDDLTASTATQAQIDGVLAYGSALANLNRGLMAMPDHFKSLAALSYDATQSLIGFSGGIEALQTNLGTYYTEFYSAEEKRANTIAQINSATAGSGFDAATATRESFRALVEAQDLTTESGQQTYAALISVAGAFAGITPALADTATATTDLIAAEKALADERASLMDQLWQATNRTADIRAKEMAALDPSNRPIKQALYDVADAQTAFGKLQSSVQAEKDRLTQKLEADKAALQQQVQADLGYLQDNLSAAKDAIAQELKLKRDGYASQISATRDAHNAMSSIAADLARAVKTVQIESSQLDRSRLLAARDLISGAAKTGNYNASGLGDALDTAGQGSQRFYSTFEAYAFDQGKTAGDIAKLSEGAQSQLDGFDRTIASLQAQDALAQSLADAQIAALQAQYELQVQSAQDAAAQAAANNEIQIAALQAQYDLEIAALDKTMADAQKQLDALMGIDNSVKTMADAMASYQDAILQAIGSVAYVAANEAIANAQAADVPGFATGGYHSGGLRIVGENGPELEATGPAMIYTADQLRGSNQNNNTAELVAEIRALRSEVSALKSSSQATANHTKQLATQFDSASEGGRAVLTEAYE